MREVESEDGFLAVLGLGGSKLTLGKKFKRREPESNTRLSFNFAACDLSPMGNTVKKFPMADLVVYRASLCREDSHGKAQSATAFPTVFFAFALCAFA